MTGTEDERVLQILSTPHAKERVLEMLAQAVDYGWLMHVRYINGDATMSTVNPYSGSDLTEIRQPR